MYLDKIGLVTTGLGNLMDKGAKGDVYNQPWTHGIGGPLASRDEIDSAWNAVKERQDLAHLGGGNTAFANLSDLRLSDEAILNLVNSKLSAFENIIRGDFPGYDSWPADAQLGMLSLAWANGPKFKNGYPLFAAAANGLMPLFDEMAKQSGIKDNAPRTDANFTLFSNAASVLRGNGDPTRLYFPNSFDLSPRQATIAKAGGVSLLSILVTGGVGYAGYKYGKKRGWL
jgi:hypothetical protein